MGNLRLIPGIKDIAPDDGDTNLVGMYDTRFPEEPWMMTNRGMDKICQWAEMLPEVIFFHFSISQEI